MSLYRELEAHFIREFATPSLLRLAEWQTALEAQAETPKQGSRSSCPSASPAEAQSRSRQNIRKQKPPAYDNLEEGSRSEGSRSVHESHRASEHSRTSASQSLSAKSIIGLP